MYKKLEHKLDEKNWVIWIGGTTMYIKHIKIKNYRCFGDFEMSFHDGLNVIVGSNNSGKTGLLRAIALLSNPDNIKIDDFNKNDLQKHFTGQYKTVPPEIVIKYEIKHTISEQDTDDESIIRLDLPWFIRLLLA